MLEIVGIAGRRGAGKDTAAMALNMVGFETAKFAGGLKAMLRAFLRYCGVDEVTIERMIEGDLKEVPSKYLQGQTPRFVMQTLGTDWGRNMIGERLWIDGFDYHIEPKNKVVVTDLRYPNEGAHIKDLGGTTMKVVDPNYVARDGDEHSSERLVDDLVVDFEIINDRKTMTIPDLHAVVRSKVIH
jgi:hypothetical protein